MQNHLRIGNNVSLKQRLVLMGALALVMSIGMTDIASAQALQPVVNATNIVRDTVVAICLALLTAAWGIAGYEVAFQGANFRMVTGKVLGGAMAGGAAAIAAVFMTA